MFKIISLKPTNKLSDLLTTGYKKLKTKRVSTSVTPERVPSSLEKGKELEPKQLNIDFKLNVVAGQEQRLMPGQ